MKKEDIKIILDAFYAGKTSVKQEQELLRYFEQEKLEEELQDEKELFLQLYHSTPIETPVNLEEKLSKLIDQLSENEKHEKDTGKTRKFRVWVGSAAACLLIAIISGLTLNNLSIQSLVSQHKPVKGEITDPQKAQVETEKALVLLSRNFNKGTDKLALVSSSMNKSNEILEKQFKKISHEN